MIYLYYAPDNASLIIRIILEELSLPYETILVDRKQQAQNSEHFLKLNPNGLIPVCIINDQPVFETAAIALILAESEQRLYVDTDNAKRPQFLKWLFFLSNSLHTDLRQRFYPEQYAGNDQYVLSVFSEMTLQRLGKHIDVLETQYNSSNDKYLFSDEPTIVDIYLAMCMRWLQLYPASQKGQITMRNYPGINAMLHTMQARPAVITACEKEGISGKFFTDPDYSNPPEGSAT